ncbi:hypothetical protein LRHK_2062 [Lacticaseibacillus rhamnosus ATCC 8530]|nr:hypothetical protein LRHK_2062 [Lacticaseibacillus rhamnosus ATCC 8530]
MIHSCFLGIGPNKQTALSAAKHVTTPLVRTTYWKQVPI